MRVLFSTVSPENYMRPPILSDQQVICGPDWADKKDVNGRVLSLNTPSGEYDLYAISEKLTDEQKPDVVVCLVDASWRNLPRGLFRFQCPKVLLLADTHHMQNPITNMLKYIHLEKFDRIIDLYCRHHMRILSSYGVENLFWFPGMTFPHGDEIVHSLRSKVGRTNQIAFVGQVGRFHPRRGAAVRAFQENSLPLNCQAVPQDLALKFYGSSLLGFNSSLNGDFNLRVFEIISSGAALLTDKLSAESGLESLLEDGRDVLVYDSPEEMIEKAKYAVEHPVETEAIGASGAKWFDTHFNLKRRQEIFKDIVLNGKNVPEFEYEAGNSSTFYFDGDKGRLNSAIKVYEKIQALHSNQDSVNVLCEAGVPEDIKAIFKTLPRVEIYEKWKDNLVPDLVVFDRDATVLRPGKMLWCWNANDETQQKYTSILVSKGFAKISTELCVFAQVVISEAQKKVRAAIGDNDVSSALGVVRKIVDKEGYTVDAALLMGEIAIKLKNEDMFKNAIDLARKIEPNDFRIQKLINLYSAIG